MNRNKRVNRKKICAILTDETVDKDKLKVLDDMKNDFYAHLADRQSDRRDRHRRTVNALRQQFQSILSQIPTHIQNLTIGQIEANGGSVGHGDQTNGPNDQTFAIRIPKAMINNTTTDELPSVKLTTASAFKEPKRQQQPPTKGSALKSASTTKRTAKENRVMTRSTVKGHTTRKVLTEKAAPEVSPTVEAMTANTKTTASAVTTSELTVSQTPVTQKSESVLRVLPHLKEPRKPQTDEEVITLCFSTAGTPLLMTSKTDPKINKSH